MVTKVSLLLVSFKMTANNYWWAWEWVPTSIVFFSSCIHLIPHHYQIVICEKSRISMVIRNTPLNCLVFWQGILIDFHVNFEAKNLNEKQIISSYYSFTTLFVVCILILFGTSGFYLESNKNRKFYDKWFGQGIFFSMPFKIMNVILDESFMV